MLRDPMVVQMLTDWNVSELHFSLEEGEQSQTVELQNQSEAGSARLEYVVTDISSGDSELDVVAVDPSEGSIAPDSSSTLSVTVDPEGLPSGSYTYEVTFTTNDPAAPELTLTVLVSSPTSAENDEDRTAFDLFPSYPNPFDGVTSIAFELPESQHVVIEVLDLTGRRVAVLADEALPGGRHEVRWEAGDLASGTYLYRMQAGTFTKTLRATLLK